jgi:hypothetical protein
LKKLIASILLMVFLFNVGGYYIVFWGLRLQADRELTVRLDANLYEREETIELKIPVVLPYPIQSQDFQRVDGRFEHQGQFYKLVKQKLENDTLLVVCIRDTETRKLVNTIRDYVKLTQDLTAPSSGKKALNFLSKLIKDFNTNSELNIAPQFHLSDCVSLTTRPALFLQPVIPVDGPPPRF